MDSQLVQHGSPNIWGQNPMPGFDWFDGCCVDIWMVTHQHVLNQFLIFFQSTWKKMSPYIKLPMAALQAENTLEMKETMIPFLLPHEMCDALHRAGRYQVGGVKWSLKSWSYKRMPFLFLSFWTPGPVWPIADWRTYWWWYRYFLAALLFTRRVVKPSSSIFNWCSQRTRLQRIGVFVCVWV